MADDLEERLKSHAQAFEGLMSLIPAKHYYAQDTSDQWQRKKQTKAQKKAAKREKLNPENHQSAKDVMDENERKRKRELEGDDYSSDPDAPGKERPREGLKLAGKESKKQKLDTPKNATQLEEDEETRLKREEKQKKIQERREKKKQRQQEKTQTNKAGQHASAVDAPDPEAENKAMENAVDDVQQSVEQDEGDEDDVSVDNEIDHVDVSGIVDEEQEEDPQSSASLSPEPESPASSAVPSASSSSSIIPPANTTNKPARIPKLPQVDQEVLKQRLQVRIEQLRAARKADGIDGKPARNRQELMEARRRKEEQRRTHKKELRKQAKEDEQRAKAEAELARLRGSGSPGTPDIFSPQGEQNNFSFGRITFDDGQQMDSSATDLLEARKKKGRQDPKTALEAAEKKKERLAGLDEEKRKDIEEKDLWLNAKKRAYGEKVRDDVSLLKKTLKRKEKQKFKSEKEWNERIQGVAKGKEMRQKKREENLKKRREEKGVKKGGKAKGAKKAKSRPGFEGSFRSKTK